MNVKMMPLSEAKDHLSGLIEEAEATHEMVTITRHGRPAAVLMAAEDLESLHEALFWLSQPGYRSEQPESEGEEAEGRTLTSVELRQRLGLSPS